MGGDCSFDHIFGVMQFGRSRVTSILPLLIPTAKTPPGAQALRIKLDDLNQVLNEMKIVVGKLVFFWMIFGIIKNMFSLLL